MEMRRLKKIYQLKYVTRSSYVPLIVSPNGVPGFQDCGGQSIGTPDFFLFCLCFDEMTRNVGLFFTFFFLPFPPQDQLSGSSSPGPGGKTGGPGGVSPPLFLPPLSSPTRITGFVIGVASGCFCLHFSHPPVPSRGRPLWPAHPPPWAPGEMRGWGTGVLTWGACRTPRM